MPTPEDWYKRAKEILAREQKHPQKASPAVPKKGKVDGE